MEDFRIPLFAEMGWVLLGFLIILGVLHLCLIWLWPLGKDAWKRVDYIWLTCALLGVFAGVGLVRQEAAQGLLSLGNSRLDSAAQFLEMDASGGTGPAVCRTLVRTEFSPPPEKMAIDQRQYDEQCDWFTSASERLDSTVFARRQVLDFETEFGIPPPDGPQWAIEQLRNSMERYNSVVKQVQKLEVQASRTIFDQLIAFLGPYLLAFAIALRMTKVTGELRKNEI